MPYESAELPRAPRPGTTQTECEQPTQQPPARDQNQLATSISLLATETCERLVLRALAALETLHRIAQLRVLLLKCERNIPKSCECRWHLPGFPALTGKGSEGKDDGGSADKRP